MTLQKPFLKWVGGKTQIIEDIINKILKHNKNYSLLKLNRKLINNIKIKIIDGMLYSTPICYQNNGGMDGFFVSCIIKG